MQIVDKRQVSQLSAEEKMSIVKDIVRYHLEHDVHGVTLCRPCHDAVHASSSNKIEV